MDLDWDSAVGWAGRVHFQPGEVTRERDPATYLKLDYAGLDTPELFESIVTTPIPLRDKSIIARPEQLCHSTLQRYLEKSAPDRLLLRIDGALNSATVACLGQLKAPRLYLALCPDDGQTIWRCDGDAELTALAGAPKLVERVFGLAVGFGNRSSWQTLARFTKLEYLALRGPALEDVDLRAAHQLCSSPALVHLDVLDVTRPPSFFNTLPACAFARETYLGIALPPGPTTGTACALKRLLLWQLETARRDKLSAACPALSEVEVIRGE